MAASPTKHMDALTKYGSIRKAADALGLKRSTFFDNVNRERAVLDSIQRASATETHAVRSHLPRYYILTAAVAGAPLHEDFFNNLKAFASYLGAELLVGPLTNANRQRYSYMDEDEFDARLLDYLQDAPLIVGDRVRFSPELNLAPTMVKPLQGLQTYTKRMWGIFPHTKISLETVPTHKDRDTKFIATTGAVTHPRYSSTKAGYRAHFDHVHGAIILEVTKKGVWFRHLTPTNEVDGSFYDLGFRVADGSVEWNGEGVTAIIYGDIHVEHIDPVVAAATWGIGGKIKTFTPLTEFLKPYYQVFHDLMDMDFANYHELDNMFKRLSRFDNKKRSLQGAFNTVFNFLNEVQEQATENIVVDSNHDYFIEKWLLNFDPATKGDFENIESYYRLKLALVRAIRNEDERSILDIVLREMADTETRESVMDSLRFLRSEESFEIDGIECGWHGHNGPNGRRGTKVAFKFVTEKSTIGHIHSPSIESGCHVVGTSSQLDLGYNRGPSSWAHTHGIVYPHGGRTLITLSDNKFWATQGDVI